MKRRHRRLLNLFSLALLAFALYLTFLKKEEIGLPPAGKALSGAAAVQVEPLANGAVAPQTAAVK